MRRAVIADVRADGPPVEPRRLPPAVALVIAVIACGLAVSGLAAAVADRFHDRYAAQLMDQYADDARATVYDEVDDYASAMIDIAAAIGTQSDMTSIDYAAITSRISQARLPGATGISLVVPATRARIPAVQTYWRSKGQTGLSLRPVGTAREHLFVVIGRTFDGTPVGYGRDFSATAEPAEAMRMARDSGQVTASRTYILLKDRSRPAGSRQRSFVLVAPVHGSAGTPDAGVFRGWIVLGMRGLDFVEQTRLDRAHEVISVTLVDLAVPASPQVVARSVTSARIINDPELFRSRTIGVGQRTWRLDIRPTEVLIGTADQNLAPGVLGIGAVMTLLLGGLVAALASARSRALTQVGQATAALRVDIERRKATEARLREREAELQAFAGVAAHDLKSPLFAMAGYAELLRDDFGEHLDDSGRECVDRILNGARRMSELIDGLLTFAAAREGRLTLQQVDLALLVTDIVAERSPGTADGGPDVQVGELPTVRADPILMHHLFDNLVGNALKYVPPGAAAHIAITATRETPICWRIEVRDRGIGVPAGQYDAIFIAFNRGAAGRGYEGTGLGLAICRRIVERHGGRIGVEPNPGGGSSFWFTLPDMPDRHDVTEQPDEPSLPHGIGAYATAGIRASVRT